jgi:DNA mismatch repair protein MutS
LSSGSNNAQVEMMESAFILKRATPQSLVIMDEVGRGTGTRDGLSLAHAILLHLHKRGAKTLFSTHYHDLAEMALEVPGIACYRMRVLEQKGGSGVLFTHIAEPGVSWNSYGIHVAKLAGKFFNNGII